MHIIVTVWYNVSHAQACTFLSSNSSRNTQGVPKLHKVGHMTSSPPLRPNFAFSGCASRDQH